MSFGFLVMGFSFTVTQALLVRELLVAFSGNELSIGLILGNWLILEAAGSGLAGLALIRLRRVAFIRRVRSALQGAPSFAVLQVLFALAFPLCLYAAYNGRVLTGAVLGEGVSLVPIFLVSFLILAPLALIDGAMFTSGCRAQADVTKVPTPPFGRVYVYEALGGMAGGVIFTYLLIPTLNSLQIAVLLSGVNLLSAAIILARFITSVGTHPRPIPHLVTIIVLLATCLGLLLSPQLEELQRWVTSQRWAGHDLVYSEDSVYGNVAVTQQEAQYTFYADGIPMLTAPVPDIALVEEMVHLPLLFVPEPRRALVLSGGVAGVLRELTKYPLDRVDYAELDPLLIRAVQRFPTSLTSGELADPRVRAEFVDGRLLVRRRLQEIARKLEKQYDLVIVNLPYPSTLQLNRFYTAEFFHMVRGLLAEEGLFIIRCPGTLTYMSQELRDLNQLAMNTLRQAFPYVRPIPGDVTLWLASPSERLATLPVETLVERWEERGLEAQLLTPYHIELKLGQDRLDWFWAALGAEEGTGVAGTTINRDLHPVGLFYGLSFWNAAFAPGLARALALAGKLSLWIVGLGIAACCLLFLGIAKSTARARGSIIPIAIATTGFTGMTADLVIIFAFQTLYGHVYHWIGLLITAFMAGLSLGALLMTRGLAKIKRERSTLLGLELAIVLFWILLPIGLGALYPQAAHPAVLSLIQGLLPLSSVVAGFLVGSQFPLANRMWLRRGQEDGSAAGILYACDLVGAFAGSIVVSVILIPVLGILETCFVAAILKACSLLLVALVPARSGVADAQRTTRETTRRPLGGGGECTAADCQS